MVLFLLIVFSPSFSAQAISPDQENSIKDLINRLNKNYASLDKALKKLENGITDFSGTPLTLSVVKHDKSIRLVSLEVMDDINLLSSHIYTPLENRALEVGGRHQLYKGEINEGKRTLIVVCYWAGENEQPVKEEAFIKLFVVTGNEYFIELVVDKKENKVAIKYSLRELK